MKNRKPNREISQLWHAARSYFRLVKKYFKTRPTHAKLTFKQHAKAFEKATVGRQRKGINFSIAHLTSSAIRLVAIEETLGKIGKPRIETNYLYEPYNYASLSDIKKHIDKNIAAWFYQLLRDNVGHSEGMVRRKSGKPDPKANLFLARQEIIQDTSFHGAISYLESNIKKAESHLIKLNLI